MKIRSVSLEHFRKFTEPISLTGLTDGLNVFAEGNEFGKSTMLAAIRGVLFERHSSRALSVTSMQHRSNKTSPIIALEFEVGGQVYRIEKRFLHKEPYAKLSMPDGTIHHGEAAEERLQEVLNFTRAGNTGSKAENIGMWGALWVPQRHSVDQPHLPDSARQTIHGCLDSEVGSLAGGTRGKALLAGARTELAKLQNGNGKPVGRHKDALEEFQRSQQSVIQLEAKRQALARDINDLASAKRKIAQADSSGEDTRTEEMLSDARQKREAAQRYEDRLKHEIAAEELAESRLAEVQREVDQRADVHAQISDAEGRVATASTVAGKTARDLKDATTALSQQRERVREARESCDEAGRALRLARTAHDLALNSQALLSLEGRLELAEEAQMHANNLAAKLLVFKVTEKSLGEVRSANVQLQKTQSTLEAQATHVTLDLLPAAANLVQLNGGPAAPALLTVIEDLAIQIEGVGTIRIQPGIKDREAQLAKQVNEQRLLRNALVSIGVETAEQAEEQYVARQRCEQELARVKKEIIGHTPPDTLLKIVAGIEALRNHTVVLRKALETNLAIAKLETAPDLDAARAALSSAEARETELSQVVGVEQAPVPDLEQRQTRTLREDAEAQSELKAAEKHQRDLTLQREQALLRETAEALTNRCSAATAALVAQRAVVAEVKKSRPTDSVAAMDIRITRYQEAKSLFASERARTLEEIAVLKSRIEREEGVGIEEQVEEERRKKDDLDIECARCQREIKVLELLLDTLEKAEQSAKERYMAPVVKRVTPYLQQLFPGAEIRCDENFQITGVVRELQQAENFDGLSVGTQEQIAVLTRLAFAEMLIDSDQPAMVILDDALAYSDDERLERMFDLLTHAAARMQILILTCRGEVFTRLGGTRVRAVTAAPTLSS
jgi:DNA repair exonuclease SbcCD ATPase subunit